ncbi:MAG: hypothetical protein LBB50_03005 [Oscillospiraceae bacterium]|jgi:hypothetical protein|nr:hypothetical protein [Oscillospiraceae bacterium]
MENNIQKEKLPGTALSRYRKKTYATFCTLVRYDDPLHDKIKAYDGNLSELIRNLLAKYLDENSDT